MQPTASIGSTICTGAVGSVHDPDQCLRQGVSRVQSQSSGDAGRLDVFADWHARIEARQPVDDCVPRDRRVSELAMLLCSLAPGEDPRCHGTGAHELAHGPMHPADVEQMILFAFGEQDVLLDLVQDAIEGMLRNRREKVEWRFGSSDVHALHNAPFEYGARQALPGYNCLGALAV